MFLFLAYNGFEYKRTVSQNWLMSQGNLRQLVPLFVNVVAAFGDFTVARLVLQKSFHHVLLVFVLLIHFLISSNFRTVSIFVLSLIFYDISDKFAACFSLSFHLYSSSKQPLHCLHLLLLHSIVLVVGKKMPSL